MASREISGDFAYKEYVTEEETDSSDALSELYCDYCEYSTNDKGYVKCSNCRHKVCIHSRRRVLLKTLGEKRPRWLCNECVKYYAQKCAKINKYVKY